LRGGRCGGRSRGGERRIEGSKPPVLPREIQEVHVIIAILVVCNQTNAFGEQHAQHDRAA
jgi:hypothetical protein